MKKVFLLLNLMTLSLIAQTNPTTLKAQIDTQITNKTGANSITKTAVGNNIKAVVDYTTQESALKVNKVAGKSLINDTEITRLSTVINFDNSGNVAAISGKEDSTNKSTNVTTDAASDKKYPSVKALKDYVDGLIPGKTFNYVIATETSPPSINANSYSLISASSSGLSVILDDISASPIGTTFYVRNTSIHNVFLATSGFTINNSFGISLAPDATYKIEKVGASDIVSYELLKNVTNIYPTFSQMRSEIVNNIANQYIFNSAYINLANTPAILFNNPYPTKIAIPNTIIIKYTHNGTATPTAFDWVVKIGTRTVATQNSFVTSKTGNMIQVITSINLNSLNMSDETLKGANITLSTSTNPLSTNGQLFVSTAYTYFDL